MLELIWCVARRRAIVESLDRTRGPRLILVGALRLALACVGVSALATGCEGNSPFVALGMVRCHSFQAKFYGDDGYLDASYLDCDSEQGRIYPFVQIKPPCQVQCLVYERLGIGMEPTWGQETSCVALPPKTSDARTVSAFIDEVCGWSLSDWDAGLVVLCDPGCVPN